MPTPPRSFGPPGQPGGGTDIKNMVIFIVLSMVILFGYDFFIAKPQREQVAAAQRAAAQAQRTQAQVEKPVAPTLDRQGALAQSARVSFDNASIDGSIALVGARFDDLSLKRYRQTVEKGSPEVTLLSPQGAPGHYDAYLGWEDPYTGDDIVGARTAWTAPAGAKLTPQTPLVLTYSALDGLVFTRTISVDDDYMFTIKDEIVNQGATARTLHPFGVVRRLDKPSDFIPNQIVHQGLIAMRREGDKNILVDETYQNADKLVKDKARGKKATDEKLESFESPGGWLGVSDHYWLTAIVPTQDEKLNAVLTAAPSGNSTDYRATYTGAAKQLAPGAKLEHTQRIFAGAKRVDVLKGYQEKLGIPDLDRAVDWGMFFFMTRPFFWLLDFLGKWVGNFGIGILLTTVVVKLALFPLVNASFKSMAKLRKVQPKLKEVQERFAADKQRQQQEMMKLYQQEKINPVAGCLPIFAQIPIFYALYKTLTVTIEMRHAPFFGWIHDLSARDPTNLFNLFGLLPFDPHTWPVVGPFLWLGALPIMYGLSMWATTSLSPQATDPTQKMVFQLMPIIFTFLFAGFAAGLVIYWTWSNILSFAQQYVIMRQNGVETEIDKLIDKYIRKKPPAPASS